MYTDKTNQREANRAHAKAYRLRKGMTQGMTQREEGMTIDEGMTVIPDAIKTKEDAVKVVNHFRVKHHPTCGCFVCRPPKGRGDG